MKRLILLACSMILFSCSKKKSEDPAPTLYTTWRNYSSKTVELYYKDGAIVKKDSLIFYGKPKDSWIFSKDGKLTIYNEASNSTCITSFAQIGDSLNVYAGDCSDNFSAHLDLSIPGELILKYLHTVYYGTDSTQYVSEQLFFR